MYVIWVWNFDPVRGRGEGRCRGKQRCDAVQRVSPSQAIGVLGRRVDENTEGWSFGVPNGPCWPRIDNVPIGLAQPKGAQFGLFFLQMI